MPAGPAPDHHQDDQRLEPETGREPIILYLMTDKNAEQRVDQSALARLGAAFGVDADLGGGVGLARGVDDAALDRSGRGHADVEVGGGQTASIRLRLTNAASDEPFGAGFEQCLDQPGC